MIIMQQTEKGLAITSMTCEGAVIDRVELKSCGPF